VQAQKWLIAAFYICFAGYILFNQDQWLGWIRSDGGSLQLPIVFLCVVLFAVVPIIPFGVVGAIVGAKYGFLLGSLINLTATTLAALITYMLFHIVFKELGERLLQRSEKLQALQRMIRNQVFWSILSLRMIPIMPAFLINCYAGVTGLPVRPFLLATLIGKIPAMLVFAYIGENIWAGAHNWIIVILFYVMFLLIVYGVYRLSVRWRAMR